MAEFSAAAELSLVVPSDETRKVRSQIERELADIEVGVSGSAAPTGGAVADGGVGGSGQRRHAEDLVNLAQTRNELLEDIAEAGGTGGDGGGAGGFLPVAGGVALGNRLAGGGIAGQLLSLLGTPAFLPGMGPDVRTGRPGSESLIPGGPDDPAGQLVASFMERTFNQATGGGPLIDISPADILGDPLSLDPGDLIGDTADISADDLLPDISITKQDVLDVLFGGGAGGGAGAGPGPPGGGDGGGGGTDRPPKPDCGPGSRAIWSPFNKAWRCVETGGGGSSSRTLGGGTGGGRLRS